MNIKVAITENNAIVRRGLVYILEDIPEVKVLFEAIDGNDLLEKLQSQQPHIILMDISMPGMNGIEATQRVKEKYPEIKVLALSVHTEEDYILEMVKKNASGYLIKDDKPEDLSQAIYSTFYNGFYFNNRVSVALLNQVLNENLIQPKFSPNIELTERELDTLKLLCEQMNNVEIADKLCVSPRTVEGYRSTLKDKIGARNLAGLVIFAIKNGYYIVE